MSVNPGPSGKGASRRSPEEFAQEVASLLKKGDSGHPERRRRIDIVTVSRIVMALTVVVFGVGVAVAVPWIGGLAGYETPGMVTGGGPVFGCPGEIEIGEVFKGETVQVVGRTDDGHYYALRDERGPGDVVYADARAITDVDDADRLPTKSCEPRDDAVVLAAATTTVPGDPIATVTTTTPTTITGDTTSTTAPVVDPDETSGRPRRRGTATPGAPTTTTPPSTAPIGPGPTTPTAPIGPGPTTPTSPGRFDHHVYNHYDLDDDYDPAHDDHHRGLDYDNRGHDDDNRGDDHHHRARTHYDRPVDEIDWP